MSDCPNHRIINAGARAVIGAVVNNNYFFEIISVLDDRAACDVAQRAFVMRVTMTEMLGRSAVDETVMASTTAPKSMPSDQRAQRLKPLSVCAHQKGVPSHCLSDRERATSCDLPFNHGLS